MDNLLRLKLEKEIDVEEFLSFLNFHQFKFDIDEEDILNIQNMKNEKSIIIILDESKLEEFKVLVLVYKDLLANKDQRHLNIPIENSLIDYERTRKINSIQLVDDNSPVGDELFSKGNKGEAPTEKDMEDSFYGYKKKKKNGKNQEPLDLVLNKEHKEKIFDDKDKTLVFDEVLEDDEKNSVVKDIFKILGLTIFTGILILIFILIR